MGSAKEARERCETAARALQIEMIKVSSDADPAVDAASKQGSRAREQCRGQCQGLCRSDQRGLGGAAVSLQLSIPREQGRIKETGLCSRRQPDRESRSKATGASTGIGRERERLCGANPPQDFYERRRWR
eukprot:3921703-Prymnesium_polylepis.1